MKAFLFVFDRSRVDRDGLIRAIDRLPEIKNWYALFGNTMCLASTLDSGGVSQLIRDVCPDLKFIVTEVDPAQKDGWLPEPVWSFLNDPQPAGVATADA